MAAGMARGRLENYVQKSEKIAEGREGRDNTEAEGKGEGDGTMAHCAKVIQRQASTSSPVEGIS